MSPHEKAITERAWVKRQAVATSPKATGSARNGTLRHFGLDPDAPAYRFLVEQPHSPAIRRFIDRQDAFEIDGGFYTVDRVLPSGTDPQTDLLILDGCEHVDGVERTSRRALQVRDLEALISDDRVGVPFERTARQYNLDHGWANGGRTLASLGISLRRASG